MNITIKTKVDGIINKRGMGKYNFQRIESGYKYLVNKSLGDYVVQFFLGSQPYITSAEAYVSWVETGFGGKELDASLIAGFAVPMGNPDCYRDCPHCGNRAFRFGECEGCGYGR